ncbi:hypothetical protein [Pseudoroseicyclus tamaricis]|uniref:Uncharacterized protein n=1 Tax=Pseudoroseicyclus tamaricis TaxID=2705421 RepID=A0A6B2JRF4_9RHOB|nr:hypothetical protein [Pseudoroseicyclus tamaricis]NDV00570.1 hypothetical protein [Pseudoroseicyclus tamaricis]
MAAAEVRLARVGELAADDLLSMAELAGAEADLAAAGAGDILEYTNTETIVTFALMLPTRRS